jgi:CheY-like chemotaxis protein
MNTNLSAPPSSEAPRRILVVDDEALFLRSFVERLADVGAHERFVVRAASNGYDALAILDAEPVDVLVTDLKMPGMDGFQLIAEVLNRKLRVPVIALTASPSGESLRALTRLGVFSFLPKPVEFADVLQLVREELAARSAHIDGINLAAFLQLLAMERTRGIVTVRTDEVIGRILVSDGNLVGAEVGDLQGIPAAFALLAAGLPTIELREHASLPPTSLCHPLMEIVLEAVRKQDELRRTKAPPAMAGSDDLVFDLLPSGPPPPSVNMLVVGPMPRQTPLPDVTEILQADPVPAGKIEEKSMNIDKANLAVEKLQESLGAGLMAVDIWVVQDGISIAGHNSQPVGTALFNRMTNMLNDTLSESGFPSLAKYYLLDLDTDKLVIVLPCGEIRAGILVDKKKVQLGIIISVALPKFLAGLEAIVA